MFIKLIKLKIMKTKLLWLLRVFEYGFNYYFLEKPRGLDFSKRSRERKTLEESSGYALTSKRSLRNILKDIPIDKNSVFIDIGSGKGGTPYFSLDLGFNKSAGLEYEDYLHKIAQNNIKILGLEESIELICGDALKFEDYYKYSHIFMFRPLNGEKIKCLIEIILDNIHKSKIHKNYFIILYGGIPIKYLEECLEKFPNFKLSKNTICPFRGNEIRVLNANYG